MTINMDPYYHWSSRGDWYTPPFNDCSPNLRQINHYLAQTFGGKSLGCHNDRDVDGNPLPPQGQTPKATPSSHAWGSALDFLADGGYTEGIQVIAPFLIQNSQELGINAIHDYHHQLIWKPGPTGGWKSASIGSPGGNWLHIETSPRAWGDGRTVEERIAPIPGPPVPPSGYNPLVHDYGLYPLNNNKPALGPGFGYTNGTQQYQGYCKYANDVMAVEAGQKDQLQSSYFVWTIYSMAACMNVQHFFGLPVNGWMTVETWGVIDGLATNFGRPR